MALEVRPAHDPVREYGFLGVVVDTTNLEGSIWTWWREGGKFHIEKTATIPAEPAPKDQLPPLLQGFGAVPPLVTDIDLSMDDRFLYVACWGTGEMRQYDVSEPRKPKLAGSVRIGGIVGRTPHPNGKPYAGGPQMVEISRDGKRVYWTNSLYSTWDNQFYPAGIPGTARIRSGSTAVIARPIHSAIRRREFERRRLDTRRTLAGRRREWPLSRDKSGDGVAARGFGRADGKELARPA
jgi:selenium-binding protein 1